MVELPAPQDPQPPLGRTRHPYFMHEMVRRQAVAGRATHRATRESLVADPIVPPAGRLLTLGLGTSFHAALAAATAAGAEPYRYPDVHAATCFDFLEDPALAPDGTTAVVFSSGGETALTMEAQKVLRARGVRSLLITAHEAGPSTQLADRTIVTQYADETSWTHTVSFSASLVAFGALLQHWTKVPAHEPEDEDAVADAFTGALATEPAIVDLVEGFLGRDQFLLVGSGMAEATAREAALKIREGAGRFCASVGVEELLHGVLPSVGPATAVLAITATELERTRALQGLAAARLAGAKTLLIDSTGGPAADGILTVPHGLHPPAAALQVVPFQLLAYWMAVSEGRNPDIMGLDEPRMLAARSSFGI
jgi:glucosamine--fructose-6-phosphate aminotransferase (isomerizing)